MSRGGTFGTKITGAGGGGCILSLINNDEQSLVYKLLEKLDELQLNHFFVNLDDQGFRLGKYNQKLHIMKISSYLIL